MKSSMNPAKYAGPLPGEAKPVFHIRKLFSLMRFVKDYRSVYIWFLFFAAMQMATYLAMAYSLKYLINTLIPSKQPKMLFAYLGVWILVFLVHSFFTLAAARGRIILVKTLVARIRAAIIQKLQVLQIKFFDQRGTGATSAKVLMDTDRLQGFFDWMMTGLVQAFFGLIIAIPFLGSINWTLALFTLVYVPTIPLTQRLFRNYIIRKSYRLRNTVEQLNARMVDYVSGIRQIRVFATENIHGKRILGDVDVMRDVDINYTMSMRIFQMIIQFFSDVMPVLLWIVGGWMMSRSSDLTLGDMVAFVALVGQFLGNVHALFQSFDQIVAASPSVAAIHEVLENTEVENSNPQHTEFELQGRIRMDAVDFSYETRIGQRQLSEISLEILPGEKVALVGESGSGKSTIVNILLGLYPITNGRVLYDDLELSTVSLPKLRSQIAVMSQETFLFNTSIFDNIHFSRMEASPEEVYEACRKAEIHDFITSLPSGYETHAGERGLMLSGGQRQRIGLARVFLRNPRIVILDEPSSALDVVTEGKLFDTLYPHMKGKTLIVIAHRLSTIRNVDRILVIKDGCVVEQGQYNQLKTGGGHFSKIVAASTYLS